MQLTMLAGDVKPYLEYAWVTAPNATGQTITANTITTLTIDTEVADTGNFGSIASNQITLAAGTYYFEASAPVLNSTDGNPSAYILSLYNVSSSSYVSRTSYSQSNYATPLREILKGQFTIPNTSIFTLQVVSVIAAVVNSKGNAYTFTLATAGADQRTTIKLWKLA